jgi:glycosyltransferase involved in cell wall biosynthesis
VPIGDIPALAGAVSTLLEQPERRRALAAMGRDVVARYSWDRTATDTLFVLERAARA